MSILGQFIACRWQMSTRSAIETRYEEAADLASPDVLEVDFLPDLTCTKVSRICSMPMIGRIVTGSFCLMVWEYVKVGEVGEVGRDALLGGGYA